MPERTYCPWCGSGDSCAVCRPITLPEPAVLVRIGLESDLKTVLEIERRTFGDWSRRMFRYELAHIGDDGGHDTWLFVAEAADRRVTGFIVWRQLPGVLAVLNMATFDTEARAAIIAKVNQRAALMRSSVLWPTAVTD